LRTNATSLPVNKAAPCNLVFLDPPYGQDLGQSALASAIEGNWLADDALIIWEENSPQHEIDGLELHDQRKYGDTWVSILQKQTN